MTSKTLKEERTSSERPNTGTVALREASRLEVVLIQRELDEYYDDMKQLGQTDPEEVFMKLAAWSARMSEVRGQLQRSENRTKTALRTKEVEKFIEEVDRQFRTWSRIQSLRQYEWDITKGVS